MNAERQTAETALLPHSIIRSYASFAFVVALAVLRRFGISNQPEAEAVAWDGLTRAIEKLHLYDAARPLAPWLAACVRSAAHDYLRHELRHRHRELGDSAHSAEDPLIKAEQMQQARQAVRKAITALPRRERPIFEAFYADGHSARAIANSLGLAEQTVRSTLSRAKKKFLSSFGVSMSNRELRQALQAIGGAR